MTGTGLLLDDQAAVSGSRLVDGASRFVRISLVRVGGEPMSQLLADFQVTFEEGPLVESFPTQPACHFVIALTGVAGAACGGDVVERVAPTTGQSEHAVALQRLVGCPAVCASTPRDLQRCPLLCAEVVIDTVHPSLSAARRPRCATPTERHDHTVSTVASTCVLHIGGEKRAVSLRANVFGQVELRGGRVALRADAGGE